MQQVKKKLDDFKAALEHDEQQQEENDIASTLFFGYNLVAFKRMMRQRAKHNTLKQESVLHPDDVAAHATPLVDVNKRANLRVIVSCIEILPKLQSNLRSPFLCVSMENVTKETPRIPSRKQKFTDFEAEFVVQDIFSEIRFSLFSAYAVNTLIVGASDLPLGCAIFPLSRLFSWGEKSVKLGEEMIVTLDLLPYSKRRLFRTVIDGMPSSGVNRDETIPGLKFHLRIEGCESRKEVLVSLLNYPPWRELCPVVSGIPINQAHIMYGKERVKRLVRNGKRAMLETWRYLRDWNSPLFSLCVLLYLLLVVNLCPLAFFPFAFSCLFVLLCYHRARYVRVKKVAPRIYRDETIVDADVPVTIPAKIKRLISLSAFLQDKINAVSSVVERLLFSLSFDDSTISIVYCCLIVGFSFLVSCVLYVAHVLIFQHFVYYVNFALVFLLGIPPKLRAIRNYLPVASNRREGAFGETTAIEGKAKKNAMEEENIPIEQLFADESKDQDDDGGGAATVRKEAQTEGNKYVKMLRNLIQRTVDVREFDHRRICMEKQNVQIVIKSVLGKE